MAAIRHQSLPGISFLTINLRDPAHAGSLISAFSTKAAFYGLCLPHFPFKKSKRIHAAAIIEGTGLLPVFHGFLNVIIQIVISRLTDLSMVRHTSIELLDAGSCGPDGSRS